MKIIKASAPGRCGIIGNPTDGYGGNVISCTIPFRASAEISPSDSLTIEVAGIKIDNPEYRHFKPDGGVFDIPLAVINYLKPANAAFNLKITTDIPMKAGLAGSTAILAAVYAGLSFREQIKIHPFAMAETLHVIEKDILHIQCGYQDHYMTVFGGINNMCFRGKEDIAENRRPVYASVESLDHLLGELPFILAHTGIQHHSGDVHTPIRERWLRGDKEVIDGYKRITELAVKGKRALLDGDLEILGELMNENHEIQASLGGSGKENDHLIRAARDAGAYGAKLAGAGKGGTIIVLTDNKQKMAQSLKAAGAEEIYYPEPVPGIKIII